MWQSSQGGPLGYGLTAYNSAIFSGGGGGSPSFNQPIATRMAILGQTGDSNGTNTGSNSRISFFNVSGATVNKIQAYFCNWKIVNAATSEINNTNNITITASIEYPAGSFTKITFSGGTGSATLTPGQTLTSDIMTLSTPLPVNTQAWVRTYVTCSSGGVWNTNYAPFAAVSEAASSGTSTTDETLSGSVGNDGSNGYGPVAIVGKAFTGTPSGIAFAGLGDSIVQGAVDGACDTYGNSGYIGRSLGWDSNTSIGLRMPFQNYALNSSTATQNTTPNLTKRLALLAATGVTHCFVEWGVNDILDAQSLLPGIYTGVANNGQKVIGCTVTPHSSGTWTGAGGAGQTAINTSAVVSLNDFIKTNPSPLTTFVDAADALSTATDSNLWNINSGWTNVAYTSDGLHPNDTSNTLNQGGVFVARDAVIPVLQALLGINYVAEDGSTQYVAEDGSTNYITEV